MEIEQAKGGPRPKLDKLKPNPCKSCGEKSQIEVVIVDRTDPSRDKIKCRHCKTSAYRQWWQRDPATKAQIEADVLQRVADKFASGLYKYAYAQEYASVEAVTVEDLLEEADAIKRRAE